MFEKGFDKKENKKFKKLLEDSVVFLDINNLKNQQKKNVPKNTTTKSGVNKKINIQNIKVSKTKEQNKTKPLLNDQKINFIPEDISTTPPQTKRLIIFVMAIFLVVFVNAFLYVNLLKYKISLNDNINQILESNEIINKEYSSEKGSLEQYKLIKEKIDIVDGLLKGHIHWTYIIDDLTNNTINNVVIKNFSGSTSGVVYLLMESKSYKDIADQINKFKTIEHVKGITINNATSSSSGYGVNFDISVEFDPKVFLNNE